MSMEYADKFLLPNKEKCDYLIETIAMTEHGACLFYINGTKEKTYGQTLNHSRIHANVQPKVFVVGPQKLDILFITKRKIEANEQLLWNYGRNYRGVNLCVESCYKCQMRRNRSRLDI